MRKIKIYDILLLTVILAASLSGCKRSPDGTDAFIESTIMSVCSKYAPDKRTAICEISARSDGKAWTFSGETNLPEVKRDLLDAMKNRNIPVTDSILVLPLKPDSSYAMVRVSVANLRGRPSHAAELVSQATLGQPLRVYKRSGGWYRVQTPDRYIAWINSGAITLFTKSKSDSIMKMPKIIFLETYGFAYEDPLPGSGRVSDLVAGALSTYIDEKDGYYHIGYPDGRTAWIRESKAAHYSSWLEKLNQEGNDLIKTARTMMGIPYLWGGTSTKGMDCSGFVQTVFFLNGMIIPRDASQQAQVGILIDSVGNFDGLQPGDLLFFGRKAEGGRQEKIIHVGLWLGDGWFIHESGDVHMGSLLPESDDYDEYNDKRYLRAKRILSTRDRSVINLKMNDIFEIEG